METLRQKNQAFNTTANELKEVAVFISIQEILCGLPTSHDLNAKKNNTTISIRFTKQVELRPVLKNVCLEQELQRSARRNAELVGKTRELLKILQRKDGGEVWCIETYRANQVEVMRLSRNMKQAYENLKRA
ncbi:4853_t:CDS:2 [Paraglomus brasilianum]|uniref:4853_t:CDS:1 n=1 Tax=Paraglomus brasilianum TaxID=144538 RepID=A0A9N9AEE5_9GLOM|nr:4853_t:CDS:2 [Paraglomus brasilianum]